MWEALVTPSLCTKVMRLVLAWGYNSKPQQGCCKGMGKGDCTLHLPATTCFLKIICYCFLTADCSLQSATQHILYPSTYSLLDPFSWCYFFFFFLFLRNTIHRKKKICLKDRGCKTGSECLFLTRGLLSTEHCEHGCQQTIMGSGLAYAKAAQN